MNISSASPLPFSNVFSAGYANSAAALRVGQSRIENRGSVIQPIDELAAVNNNARQTTIAASNFNGLDNTVLQDTLNNEQRTQILDQEQQREQQENLERQQIQELVARDREVRNHERAHAAVGGQYAGSPRYTFERGPDGINYAVGGEVSISTGPVAGDPEATIQKAQIIRRAALAPTEPSAQDRSVAAQAVQLEAQARIELQNLRMEESIEAEEAIGARKQRSDHVLLPTSNLDAIQSEASQNNSQEIQLSNVETNAQRLSDELNLRIRQTDPFGVPEPGQVFSQFI